MQHERQYRTLLLRLWSVHQNGGVVWRASVEDVHGGKRRAFSMPTAMLDFLCDVVHSLPMAESDNESPTEDV